MTLVHQRIREELKHMSFEDLQKMREKLGSKVYNATLFGKNNKVKKREFNKLDRDKPLEVSAKRRVPRLMQVVPVKKPVARDPRFDRLCGEYNERAFKKDYGFLDEVKKNDLKTLRKELQKADDPETIKKIKYLIQRLENQLRETDRKMKKQQTEKMEKQEILEAIKKGEKPHFKKKSEKKILDLVAQYEELKESGKLKKHIQRLRKKKMIKDRKKMAKSDAIDD
ncbi:ribosomal RNA processing protein 36 homolog [Chelonus insularis]|uniref:ribosomal RNA processing protein 36 homolog n=1 Tax=Chelonus insularis TaxID=460826 RepID=UPI00158F5C6F|nr:ribosomal RNA processing protein 36 homolog [Chelonus insularis]